MQACRLRASRYGVPCRSEAGTQRQRQHGRAGGRDSELHNRRTASYDLSRIRKRVQSAMRLLTVREAAERLGVGYSTLKQWIYQGRVRTRVTGGGHHRIPEGEVDRLLAPSAATVAASP